MNDSGQRGAAPTDSLTERIYAAEKNITWIRIGVIVFNSIAYLTLLDPEHTVPWLAWTIIFIANPYAFYVVLAEPYRRWSVLLSAYFTSISDGVLIALWVIATGGVHSEFYVIWYVSIVAVAFRFGYRPTIFTCFFYSVCYLAILLPFGELPGHETEVVIRIAYIFLAGGISALIGAEVHGLSRAKFEAARRADEAEAANLAKSEFLANMSHEIRTPLNGVIGMTGLLLDTDLSLEQRDYAETIESAADTLVTLINDVLDLSRLESGQIVLEEASFDLRSTVDRTVELFTAPAEQKGLELALRWAPDTPRRVRGDPGRIRQILTNLVGNAVKFTEKGQVLVDVSPLTPPNGDLRVRFEIRDTGIGIAADKVELVFERFTQADGSTTRRYGGTGLGLAISRQLVRLLGGEIGVESGPGEGSTFWFEIPLRAGDETGMLPPPATDLSRLRVLVVDDNPVNRRVLLGQIGEWAARCREAVAAGPALRALHDAYDRGEPFHIAVLDQQMPDVDGETLARRIKSDPNLRETVLVALTSSGQRGDARRVASSGFAAYLTKPVPPSTLRDAIATAWASRTAPQPTLVTRHSLAERDAHMPPPVVRRAGRILIAEDNPVNFRVAKLLVERLGYEVGGAGDGRAAAERALGDDYDLVLMDCQMPEVDGYAATREIRRGEKPGRHVPIVAMTAHAMPGDRERCLAAGMDDYLTKPIRRETLERVLDRWLPAASPAPAAEGSGNGIRDQLRTLEEEAGREFVDEVLDGFLRGARGSVAGMRDAAEAGDATELARLAHGLKGSGGTLGAERLAALCSDLEETICRGELDGVLGLVREIEASFAAVERDVAAWRSLPPCPPTSRASKENS